MPVDMRVLPLASSNYSSWMMKERAKRKKQHACRTGKDGVRERLSECVSGVCGLTVSRSLLSRRRKSLLGSRCLVSSCRCSIQTGREHRGYEKVLPKLKSQEKSGK